MDLVFPDPAQLKPLPDPPHSGRAPAPTFENAVAGLKAYAAKKHAALEQAAADRLITAQETLALAAPLLKLAASDPAWVAALQAKKIGLAARRQVAADPGPGPIAPVRP